MNPRESATKISILREKMTSKSKTATKAPEPVANNGTSQQSNLFISINTFDAEGRTIGERVVDLYHFGTRNWLQSHHWWAMHNGHSVETNVATPKQIDDYLAAGKAALAAKFNTAAVAAVEAVAA